MVPSDEQPAASNSALVARATGGDRDALAELLEIHGPRVEHSLHIGRPWRSMIDTGDVMQISYLEAFLEIGRFRPEQFDSFEAWLRRIAQNNLRDAIRGLERQKQPPPRHRLTRAFSSDDSYAGLFDTLAACSSTPSRVVSRKEVQRLVETALEQLPPDYARSVRMYDLEGRSIADVAAALGRSPGAVHMLRARAHERMGELLASATASMSHFA